MRGCPERPKPRTDVESRFPHRSVALVIVGAQFELDRLVALRTRHRNAKHRTVAASMAVPPPASCSRRSAPGSRRRPQDEKRNTPRPCDWIPLHPAMLPAEGPRRNRSSATDLSARRDADRASTSRSLYSDRSKHALTIAGLALASLRPVCFWIASYTSTTIELMNGGCERVR